MSFLSKWRKEVCDTCGDRKADFYKYDGKFGVPSYVPVDAPKDVAFGELKSKICKQCRMIETDSVAMKILAERAYTNGYTDGRAGRLRTSHNEDYILGYRDGVADDELEMIVPYLRRQNDRDATASGA